MEIKDLIIDDRDKGIFRVHRSSMTSTELFQRERQQIFDKCWLYLGHESEVGKPGDYHGPHVRVPAALNRAAKLLEHFRIEGVSGFGPVQGYDAHRAYAT